MHIPQPKYSQSDQCNIIDDLNRLILQPTANEEPPCPNCSNPQEQDTDCSYKCTNAGKALSEDPQGHPIEPRIVPLIFELTTMRIVQTCWSCEGHTLQDGKLIKIPQVSFYAEKPFYAQLINKYIKDLYIKKKLSYPWEVCLSDYGQTLDITYTIKCDLDFIEHPELKKLHEDLFTMGENLSQNIKIYAKQLIKIIENNFNRN